MAEKGCERKMECGCSGAVYLHHKADVALEALGGRLAVEGDGALPLHVPADTAQRQHSEHVGMLPTDCVIEVYLMAHDTSDSLPWNAAEGCSQSQRRASSKQAVGG